MHRGKMCAAIVAALFAVTVTGSHAWAQNLLANPGFEDPITFDGPPFVGFWEGFNGPGVSSAANGTVMPRSGAQHLLLNIENTQNTFAGAFQDVEGLVPGQPAIFSGWHMTPSNPFDVGVEIRIEWRDSVSNTEISRTPNLTTAPGGQYEPFTLAATVPAGADSARIVYAIQSFGGLPTNTGTIYVDDTSFVIPEPSSMLALTAAGLALTIRRRRN